MSTNLRFALLTPIAFVVACGKPLGTYQVRDVRLVPGTALEAIEPYREPGPELLRIEFTSKTDLYEASDADGNLYLWASFCPYENDKTLRTYGPYYNDKNPYGSTRVISRNLNSDGKVVEVVHLEDRRPIRNPQTGNYTYTTYLRPSAPADQWNAAYDLRRTLSDVCLRIDHPGYFITPSRSHVFEIPAQMIRQALSTERLSAPAAANDQAHRNPDTR